MGNSILSNYRNLTSDIMGIHHGINPPLYPANINELLNMSISFQTTEWHQQCHIRLENPAYGSKLVLDCIHLNG